MLQIDVLQKTIDIYEEERRSLLQELEASEQRLQRELSDMRQMEQRLNSVVTDTQLKWQKECVSFYQHNRVWILPLQSNSQDASFPCRTDG